MTTAPVLEGRSDPYGGINITLTIERAWDGTAFDAALASSLIAWRSAGKRGAWLTVPAALSSLVPYALARGFVYHHAECDHVVLCSWLPDPTGPSPLPTGCTHQVGVGALVVNENNEILLVREATGPAARPGLWKIPTGLVNAGEELCDAVVRECLEETGIDSIFEKVLVARHGHKMLFGKSDLFFVCLLRPRLANPPFVLQASEIAEARWCPWSDFISQAPYPSESPLWQRVYELCADSAGGVGAVDGLTHERLGVGFGRPWESSIYYNASSNAL